ncbi:MAG: RNA degradosome polyphosphate kinase [Bacteroidales bacterium]|nr:RNA degradosome polyphosphate kinase [Bacteroidales bacterium]
MKIKTVKNYLPRDISWMYFNRRILQEASKKNIPLLERISFLGIYSNNLDEFFRVRVATHSRVAEWEDSSMKKEREEAVALLKDLNKLNAQYSREFESINQSIMDELREENIYILKDTEVDDEMLKVIHKYYLHNLNGRLMPVWFSAIKEFALEKDENIYMAVKMTSRNDVRKKPGYAFMELPVSSCGRFVRLPDRDGHCNLMFLDDIIRCCLPFVFRGLDYTDFEAYSFKFTRDAEMEIDNDLRNGTMQKISKGVKSRKRGAPLRVVFDAAMPKGLLKQLMGALKLDKLDTVLAGGRYQNHKDYMRFPDCDRKDLKYPSWEPILKKELTTGESLMNIIRRQDRFIHVPYHSFDSYVNLLQEAAISRDVKGIKTTLYRLAKDSKVVKALIGAARNGKKVTVVIELLARFDEASNIDWSKKMQEAGVHVIFGVEGLKVHSKLTYISMKTGSDIACISTGNFHEGNARTYTDYMLMTASRPIVRDVDAVFRFIERPYTPIKFKELLVSPNEMKQKFLRLLNDEIRNRQAGKPAYIKIKINHITDPVMVNKLYEAAENGVKIDLLVRGNCSLIPTLPQLNGNMRIVGIIDRYLEHSRIFIFCADGQEKTFIGSADWMPRNLDNRVEVVTPVYNPEIKADLKRVVEYGLNDTCQGRIVDGTGSNSPLEVPADGELFRSQSALYEFYKNEEEQKSNEIPQ